MCLFLQVSDFLFSQSELFDVFDSLIEFSTSNEFSDSIVSTLESNNELEKFGKPQSQQIHVQEETERILYKSCGLQCHNTEYEIIDRKNHSKFLSGLSWLASHKLHTETSIAVF